MAQRAAEDWAPAWVSPQDRRTLGLGHLAEPDPREPRSRFSPAVPDLCLTQSFFSAQPALCHFPSLSLVETSPPAWLCSICTEHPSRAKLPTSWSAETELDAATAE